MLTKFPKILIIIFLSIFIIQLVCLMTLLLIPKTASAISYTPQVPVPGYTFDESAKSTKNIAEYVKAIYKYAIGIVGIIAAVVLMFGGILWLTAGGSAERIGQAKSWIGSSLAGLLIALTSYLILATINPALVNFKITGVTPAQEANKIQTLSSKEIDDKCTAECSDTKAWQYDPVNNKCNCWGSGKHKECQSDYDLSGNKTFKCVEVPYAGEDKCTTDSSCEESVQGCCLSNYGVTAGLSMGYRQCSNVARRDCVASGSSFNASRKCWQNAVLGAGTGTYYCK